MKTTCAGVLMLVVMIEFFNCIDSGLHRGYTSGCGESASHVQDPKDKTTRSPTCNIEAEYIFVTKYPVSWNTTTPKQASRADLPVYE